tara:strand:+ start:31218 stop:31523 length:306 start_codon:yes stop_codon:yes gene_type:complete
MFLEMKLWEKKRIREIFGLTAEFAQQTRVMALNQGLYNGFLAAGLLWALVHPDAHIKLQLQIFFLGCVLVAGVVGALSVTKRIFWIQAFPASLALLTLAFK